jgi:bacillithiol system protein YtxJ
MHPRIACPQRIEDLDRLLAQTSDRPLLLFKHSLTCGTSAEALDELLDHINGDGLDARYAILTVQSQRELSNAVSARLGVRHETPQALLIRHGRVIWSASHFRVTATAVQSAIRSHAVSPSCGPDA